LKLKEYIKIWFLKLRFNFFPAYRRSGARIIHIDIDFKHIQIQLPLNWKTRNISGTIYGGSMYSAIDPVYMVMFTRLLDKQYTIWDKSAIIDFKKPGRSLLKADFYVSNNIIKEIIEELKTTRSIRKTFFVDLIDEEKDIVASFEKVLYFANKDL